MRTSYERSSVGRLLLYQVGGGIMHNPRFLYALNQILRVMFMLLISILIVFDSITVTAGIDTQYIYQAGLQRARS